MKVLIFGAHGSIGSAVERALLLESQENSVIAPSRKEVDVTKWKDLVNLVTNGSFGKPFDAIIYSVGHCPPGEFERTVEIPLSLISNERFVAEWEMHVHGLQNVFQLLVEHILPRGCFVVVSSAITRLTNETCPPWLYAGHYAAAKAGQDELVRWMRRDPAIQGRGIKIHRLALTAVNTPFFECATRPLPPMLSLSDVAREVLTALKSGVEIDKVVDGETISG